MKWAQLFVAIPFVALGFLFQWVRDMFDRGRAYYDWLTAE